MFSNLRKKTQERIVDCLYNLCVVCFGGGFLANFLEGGSFSGGAIGFFFSAVSGFLGVYLSEKIKD